MSGYATYDFDPLTLPVVHVPVVKADEKSLEGYGILTPSFDPSLVDIVPWPRPPASTRPLMAGTGRGGGLIVDEFDMWLGDDHKIRAHNKGLGNDPYTTGLLLKDGLVVTREANYHPDSSQQFFPQDENAFYLLLALPSDDVTASDFTAFYFDGSCGCQIHPGVWHQPPYFCNRGMRGSFHNAQGAVHACVGYDSLDEQGVLLGFDVATPIM